MGASDDRDLDALLAEADRALDDTERRKREARARRTRELEAEAIRLVDELQALAVREKRAESLDADDVLRALAEAAQPRRERLEAIRKELGYDPQEKRRTERAARSERMTEELVDAIRRTQHPTLAEDLAREVVEALPRLRRDDARAVLSALLEHARQHRWDPGPALRRLEQIVALAEDHDAYLAAADTACTDLAREREVVEQVDRLQQDVGLLETRLGRYPPAAIRARVHGLACEAKLLQRRDEDLITPEQHDRLRRLVFGRLHAIVKDTSCGFVPSLRQDWLPDSLEDEIATAERDFEAASTPPSTDPEPAAGPDAAALQARLRQAEQWVLAEIYRRSNRRFENPGDDMATARLVQAVEFAIGFLDERRDELARILRHDADLFAEGSEFRWLRRRFAKLSGDSDGDDDGAPPDTDDATDSGAIEGIDGAPVLHPSVMRALSVTRGRHVVMVGGALRAERRDRLRELFDAREWEWISCERDDGQRVVQKLATRIRNGSMDIVVCLLGFLGHSPSDKILAAAREHGVPCAVVPHGYGEASIAEALLAMKVQPSPARAGRKRDARALPDRS